MKILKCTALILFSLTLFVSEAQDRNVRKVDQFSKIKMKNSYVTLHLSRGNVQEIVLEGPDEILEKIMTEVSNSKLSIWSKSDHSKYNQKIDVFVTLPLLTHIALTGPGDIVSENELRFDKLQISHSGTGTIKISTKSSELVISQSGNGEIILDGSTNSFTVSKSGKGNLYARKLTVKKCSIGNSGSGKCEVLCPYTY